MDEEYNKKQFIKDTTNILSSFSNSNYLPMTLHDFKVEDSSDDFKKVDTLSCGFQN